MSANFTPNLVDYSNQGEFRFWCQKVLPLVYDDSLSYYELLNKVVDYLNNAIADISAMGGNVDELLTAYDELQEYVNEQFGDGDLTEYVNAWLNDHPDVTTTLQDYAVTMNKLNDSVSGFIENAYYSEITYEKIRMHDTDCYIATIPKYDSEENLILPYLKYSTDTPLVVAEKDKTTFTCNGTIGASENGNYKQGVIISQGNILNSTVITQPDANAMGYVAFTEERSFTEYPIENTTAQTILNGGAYNAFLYYWKLIENGSMVDNSGTISNEGISAEIAAPRLAFGVKQNGDFVYLACDGRTDINSGLSSAQVAAILLSYGCVNAWNMDGGGSTSMEIRGSKINRNIDNNGTVDRPVAYTLNVKKSIPYGFNNILGDAYAKIGAEKQNVIQQIIPYINEVNDKVAIVLPLVGLNIWTKLSKNNRINASSSKTVTLPSAFKGIIANFSSNSTANAILMVACTTSGSVSVLDVAKGSNFSYTTSSFSITLNNGFSAASYFSVFMMDGTGDIVVS